MGTQSADGYTIPNAYPLQMYDNHKCPTSTIMVYAKQDVATCSPRPPQYTSKLWNCRRPYLRCTCSQNAKSRCKGEMIWFDQAIWFMLNNLERFFDKVSHPSLAAKFGAFLTWISAATSVVVRMQISFLKYRHLMEIAAIELAVDPSQKLLAIHGDAPGALQVERMFKLAAFTIETTPTHTPPPYSKKRRINVNVTPEDHFQSKNNFNRGRSNEYRPIATGGRGRYNKNFRPTGRGRLFPAHPPNDGQGQTVAA